MKSAPLQVKPVALCWQGDGYRMCDSCLVVHRLRDLSQKGEQVLCPICSKRK